MTIAWLAAHATSLLARSLAWRPLAALGSWSYGIYLVHLPLWWEYHHLLARSGRNPGPWLNAGIAAVATCAIAAASWWAFESRILRMKDRVAPLPRSPDVARAAA